MTEGLRPVDPGRVARPPPAHRRVRRERPRAVRSARGRGRRVPGAAVIARLEHALGRGATRIDAAAGFAVVVAGIAVLLARPFVTASPASRTALFAGAYAAIGIASAALPLRPGTAGTSAPVTAGGARARRGGGRPGGGRRRTPGPAPWGAGDAPARDPRRRGRGGALPARGVRAPRALRGAGRRRRLGRAVRARPPAGVRGRRAAGGSRRGAAALVAAVGLGDLDGPGRAPTPSRTSWRCSDEARRRRW